MGEVSQNMGGFIMSYEVKVYYGGSMSDHCEKYICEKVRVDSSGDGIVLLKNEYDPLDLTTILNEGVILSPTHYAKISYNEIEDHIMERMRLDKRVNNNMKRESS
jgi:hypothetical protein